MEFLVIVRGIIADFSKAMVSDMKNTRGKKKRSKFLCLALGSENVTHTEIGTMQAPSRPSLHVPVLSQPHKCPDNVAVGDHYNIIIIYSRFMRCYTKETFLGV